MYENGGNNNARSLNNARSPSPSPRARIDICGPHHDVRRHVACKKCNSRVLTKAQQAIVHFWVRDDAELVNVLLDAEASQAHACLASFCVFFFYRPTWRPRPTSLPLECHRNATNRARSVSSARNSLKSKVGLAAAKAAALRINLNVVGCGIVAAPVHAPSRAPLLLPLLLSHNLPLPRVH